MTDHDGELNIEAYQIMVEILVTVRRIIHRGLEKAAGKTWYLDGCPPGVYERLVARKENEVAIDRFDREYQELISFASLDDLAEIIEYNDDLAHLLEGIAPERATIVERFRQIESLRLKLDATVPFDEDDLETLIAYHEDFRRSLAKPNEKEAVREPEQKTVVEAEEAEPEPVAEEDIEDVFDEEPAAADLGTRASEVDDLSADDIVSDDEVEDFGTAVVDSDVIVAPDSDGTQDESVLKTERAVASGDDGAVLRVLHGEIMSVAVQVLRGDIDREFPVWQTLNASGWYDLKSGSLALAPVERFYSIAEKVRSKLRSGDAEEEIKAFVSESEVSKVLLTLGEMFKRHNL